MYLRFLTLLIISFTLLACKFEKQEDTASADKPDATVDEALIHCGYVVGSGRIVGAVQSITDGDTFKVNGEKVRLAGIDAPEAAQEYGLLAKDKLESYALGKTVTVGYQERDQYGRILGSVFLQDCTLVNLEMVKEGAAWWYESYQCQDELALRKKYSTAQSQAKKSKLGLWAEENPVAPWVYRNGTNPRPASCKTDMPSWYF
ncbi:MAG: hypothetical protein RL217_482 [Pseudomonadota bacterium]|jgi:endonuclease YncB( thermonuclease family)